MGKLIAKTAAITFACIIVVALVLFGIFSLFVPSVMVSLTDSLGMTGACALLLLISMITAVSVTGG